MTASPMISYRQFDEWLKQGKATQLVDLWEPWMYEHDRPRGNMNIPCGELECNVDPIRRDGTVASYCDRGAKSMVVCRNLWRSGYNAVDLAGGMSNYREKYTNRSPVSAMEQKLQI